MPTAELNRKTQVQSTNFGYRFLFDAMASPCEILINTRDQTQAIELGDIAAKEAWRIEQKFSRYRDDSILAIIHSADGHAVKVDEETVRLLNFAEQAYQISEGLFDITSGVLRKVWHFDGSDKIPEKEQVKPVLELVGWKKVIWQAPYFTLPKHMQIDFGGLGKEYAVDRAALLINERLAKEKTEVAFMINFGGDLYANRAPKENTAWQVGIEAIAGSNQTVMVQLKHGALATSGDARRFLLRRGKRYSHVLNPLTGWPVEKAPASVTVAGPNCIDAGLLATLAILQGEDAEAFLKAQEVVYYLQAPSPI